MAESVAPSTHADTPSGKPWTPGHKDAPSAPGADPAAGGGSTAISPNSSLGAVNAAADLAAAGAASVSVGQLADWLASEASDLASPATSTTAASSSGTAQAVKELQINLDPADLGAVSVTMRIAQGQLSVVMEVAKQSTLNAIENERGAIADRLGLSAQSLESLIIKPSATSQTGAESANAQDQQSGSQGYAQGDSNRPSQGDGQQPSRGQNATGRWSRSGAAPPPSSSRGFGDLVV